jgi:hypothetical protein
VALLVVAVFVLSALTDLRVLPTDGALGTDFNDFYVAAVAQSRALNPYDGGVLTRIEEHTFGHASFSNTVASPPAFFVAFRPFVWLTPRQGYLIWLALSTVAWLAALRAVGAALGIRRDRLLWMLALSPPTVIAMFLGQISLLLTACYLWAICCALSRRHAQAGLLLALTLVKPHLMIVPVALLCGLTWRSGGRKTALWTVAWTLAICALAVPFSEPDALRQWVRALVDYGSRFDRWQPDISSLAGAYLPYVPRPVGRVLSALCVLGGLACAAWLLRVGARRRVEAGDRRWWRLLAIGIACWLLVLPYIHPYDDMLLLAPLLVLLALGRDSWPGVVQVAATGKPLVSRNTPVECCQSRAASTHLIESHRSQAASTRLSMPQGMALLAILGMLCMPQLDLMGFRPNLTFSYTVLPVLATLCALLAPRARAGSRDPDAAEEQGGVGDQHW